MTSSLDSSKFLWICLWKFRIKSRNSLKLNMQWEKTIFRNDPQSVHNIAWKKNVKFGNAEFSWCLTTYVFNLASCIHCLTWSLVHLAVWRCCIGGGATGRAGAGAALMTTEADSAFTRGSWSGTPCGGKREMDIYSFIGRLAMLRRRRGRRDRGCRGRAHHNRSRLCLHQGKLVRNT